MRPTEGNRTHGGEWPTLPLKGTRALHGRCRCRRRRQGLDPSFRGRLRLPPIRRECWDHWEGPDGPWSRVRTRSEGPKKFDVALNANPSIMFTCADLLTVPLGWRHRTQHTRAIMRCIEQCPKIVARCHVAQDSDDVSITCTGLIRD